MSNDRKKNIVAKPFLKWAGGKGKLIQQLEQFLPQSLKDGLIRRYIEPFIGGGAFFFYLASQYKIEEFFISDLNTELIIAYETIQQNVEDLISCLEVIQTQYWSFSEEQRKEYFYQTRATFNTRRKQINYQNYNSDWLEKTSQLIFLNRTCFNGLYRVNSKGDFNVPMGRYKRPTICDANNLRAVARILQKTQIYHGDFSECEKFVNQDSFVYFDPPYRPISKTANFTAYSQQVFNDEEQLRLRNFFRLLDSKRAVLMLSNSDPQNQDLTDIFFEVAYQEYQIKRVKASRNINSKASNRGQINELLIMNY